jgi:hypothetical protein
MWMIRPIFLCKFHLLGEHGELHKHRHNFIKQYSILGRIIPIVQIELESMKIRHDELSAEMLNRGYKHHSLYIQPNLNYLPDWQRYIKVNIEESLKVLYDRCFCCKLRIRRYKNGLERSW